MPLASAAIDTAISIWRSSISPSDVISEGLGVSGDNMPDPIFLVGPTCVGKSEVAISLAQQIGAEIVSCDSMQVYRGMDIATAKPTSQQRNKVPHHMIDIVDITQEYDVAQYRESACKKINDIQNRGKIPLVVGGTGLYVRALVDGLFTGPGRDKEIRNKLEERIKKEGLGLVYEELKKIDPVACTKIKPKDKRRIIRALEVCHATGKPISSFQREWGKAPSPNPLPRGERGRVRGPIIGLNRDRKDLYNRIDRRVEEMFQRGLVDETESLIQQGIMQNETAGQALGYKEVVGYLDGRYSLEETKDLLKRNTRRFAKRQLTWFRKDDRVTWILIHEDEEIEVVVKKIMNFLKNRV